MFTCEYSVVELLTISHKCMISSSSLGNGTWGQMCSPLVTLSIGVFTASLEQLSLLDCVYQL